MIQSSNIILTDSSVDTDSDRKSSEEDGKSSCPLCDVSTETVLYIYIYAHLQVGHRKSEIAELVVDW